MRSLLFIVSAMVVMALAIWAYQENYKTQLALRDVEDVQRQIGDYRQELAVLRAEWAYLNRPDRLRELTNINFDRLGLFPLTPGQFGRVDQISFPADPMDAILNSVDVVGTLESDQ